MKNRFLLITAMILAVACEKNAGVDTPTGSENTVDSFDSSGINVYSVKDYSQEEFCDYLGESFDDYLDFLEARSLNFVPKHIIEDIFDENASAVDSAVVDELGCSRLFARDKWGVRQYNFTYRTYSYTQEPITLSAALCVPVLLDKGESHTISALSLCPPHMPYEKENCPTVNGTILMARTAFNHAVVVPDYQGRGVTSSTPYSSLHTHDHAVQAIHAAMAAKIILENEGFIFDETLPLYNVGVSEGGETSYETHKMIENDLSDEKRNALNLKLTFSANGIARHSLYVTSQLSIYNYDEDMHEQEMMFYKDAFDCFSEAEKQGHDGMEFLSPDLVDENGKIILDSPIVKVTQEAVSRNDITYNWNPRHKITLAASTDDDDVLFQEHTVYMYDLIKNHPDGSRNEDVSLMSFETPICAKISELVGPDYMISHIAADICCFVHAIRYIDPGSESL